MLSLDEEAVPATNLTFPSLQPSDLNQVAQVTFLPAESGNDPYIQTILQLFAPETAGAPELAKQLQSELQRIQQTPEAWGLISGLASHDDPNVRFFSAHTAQVKISRDWETLPAELQPSLLTLLLQTLSNALSPANPQSFQPANAVVVRKLFGCLASLLLRLPFPSFPHPILTVLQTIASAGASSMPLPPSAPGSGYNTPHGPLHGTAIAGSSREGAMIGHKLKLWGLEWCGICVEEISRAGLSDIKRNALRRHLDSDMTAVLATITESMAAPRGFDDPELVGAKLKEAEAACRCAESWVSYGLGGDELTALLPHLYGLLPLPAASVAVVEVLSESLFKYGKGAKILTEPLLAWIVGPSGQSLVGTCQGGMVIHKYRSIMLTQEDPSEKVIGFAKLLCALVEHSSDWFMARIEQQDVQSLLSTILRLTSWQGTGGVDESVSELTLPIYPLLQEAIMDCEAFAQPYETAPIWGIAKHFFRELVSITRTKSRWPGFGEDPDGLGGLDKEDRETFETWRRDAGEVIVCAYYILREHMLTGLVEEARQQASTDSAWQDIEATLHCVRYSSEAVPLGEEKNLPILFSDQILGRLAQRPLSGLGEERLRLTAVCLIQSYEEWFKFHPDHLLPVLSYLVPSLTSTKAISRSAADSLKALCDICRAKLVQHIDAFAELHGKLGQLGPEEQTKVVQAITSVIQALSPADAVGPVEGILSPICEQLERAIQSARTGSAEAQPALVAAIDALTACFRGLSPSDDDIFDVEEEADLTSKADAVKAVKLDQRMLVLRSRIEQAVTGVVEVWQGDGEVADSISSLVKHSTLSSSETLISLSPLPLLSLVTTACERAPSALWMSLGSTLVLRINSPPSPLTQKRDRSAAEEAMHQQEEQERWNVIADSASRVLPIASHLLAGPSGIHDNPDVSEAFFKYASAVASRFPGVLLRFSAPVVEAYVLLGIAGLGAQERFSVKSATEFFVALFATTRFPSPLEPQADSLVKHFGPQMLRAILLSAGADGPRSVIPNLAELLAAFVTRVKGEDMAAWLDAILGQEGFPDPRATYDSKKKLKEAILRSRTTRKMREALHEFALVARGLDNTTYGNATAV